MAGLARRLAPAAALGGLAMVIVGVADPALAGHTEATATGGTTVAPETTAQQDTSAQPDTTAQQDATAQPDTTAQDAATTCANGQTATGGAAMTPWGPARCARCTRWRGRRATASRR